MLIQVSKGSTYPVTLAELKAHVRVDGTSEDTYLTGLIKAATDFVETETHRDIVDRTWDEVLPCFADKITLKQTPVKTISSVSYYDADGTSQTLSTSIYTTVIPTSGNAFIVEAPEQTWPETQSRPDAVTIRYTTGYATIPDNVKHVVLLMAGNWYEHREAETEVSLRMREDLEHDGVTNWRYTFGEHLHPTCLTRQEFLELDPVVTKMHFPHYRRAFEDGYKPEDTRFVCLKRRDIVATAVSSYLAQTTRCHHAETDEDYQAWLSKSVELDEARLMSCWRTANRNSRAWDDWEGLRIFYEDLVADPMRWLVQILDYLGMSHLSPSEDILHGLPLVKMYRPETVTLGNRLHELLEICKRGR